MSNGKASNNNVTNSGNTRGNSRRARRVRQRQVNRPSNGANGQGARARNSGASNTAANISRPRDPANTISALSTSMANMSTGRLNPYVHCRLNPFTGEGRTPIPDGKNSMFVVIDNMTVDTIFCEQDRSSFTIQTLPALPAMAMIRADPSTNLTVNGIVVTAPATQNPAAITAANASYPIAVPAPFANIGAAPGGLATDPYGASKARLIAVGYRLIYTGPALTCAGAIVVTPNDVSFTMAGTTTSSANPPVGNSYSLLGEGPNQVPVYTAGLGTPVLGMDVTMIPTIMNRESTTYRPEQGVLILPKHKTSDYKISALFEEPFGVVADFNTGLGLPAQFRNVLSTTGSGYNGGIIWYDNDWGSLMIRVTGVNANASFRLETVSCFEFNPVASSAFAPLSAKTSPLNPNAMEQARKSTAELPSALPLTGRPR